MVSLLVPEHRRADWLREWRAELAARGQAGRNTGAQVLGALPHAIELALEEGTTMVERFGMNVRAAARALARRPLFTMTVVTTLGVGIAGAVAVFSVVDAVLLRPLPFPDADRIVLLGEASEDGSLGTTSFETGVDWRDRSRSFDALALFGSSRSTLTGEGDPEQIPGLRVSWSYFDVLGVRPALGRGLEPQDDHRAAERVVVLSHALWARRFASDPSVIGRAVSLSGLDHTVVGVMPSDFEPVVSAHLYQSAQLWTPLRYEVGQGSACRTCRHLRAVARLGEDVDVGQARREIEELTGALEREHPDAYAQARGVLLTLGESLARPVRSALLLLLGSVCFVLLIACGNVAGLLVARATDQRREVSLRAALGASRGDLLGRTAAECGLLAAAGGTFGTALGSVVTRALVRLAPTTLPSLAHVGLDGRVTAFAIIITVATALVFGLTPLLAGMRAHPAEALKEGARGTTSGAGHRARSTLVVVNVAVAIVLLVGTGLTTRSFARVLAVDPGFRPEGVVKMQVNASGPSYRDGPSVLAFHQEVLRRVREIPGVASAGLATQVPLDGNFDRVGIAVEGVDDQDVNRGPSPERYAITGDYLAAMGIPLLEGRTFDGRDTPDGDPVLLVNETFAQRFARGGSVLGVRVRMGSDDAPWLTVVGVVGDVRHYALERAADLQVYLPQSQFASSSMTLVVKATGDSDTVVDGVRQAVWAVDRDIPVPGVATFDRLIADATAQRRFVVALMAAFAGVALVLTVIGIHGLLAVLVSRRTHEIGIRLALGAHPTDVVRLVVGQGIGLAALGVGAGLLASLGLTRFVAGMLFGVGRSDPPTLVAVSALMLAVALAACWLPARRATRVRAPIALSGD